MSPLTAAARRFRAAHHGPRPLVLPNVWDAVSARVFADAGFGALATSSGAVAEALGYADGQRTPSAEMFAAIARITRSVDVPVTADIEAGYGLAPGELAGRLADAQVVGCNLEDSDPVTRELADPGHQADYLAAVHAVAGEALVINARVDVFVRPRPAASATGSPAPGGRGRTNTSTRALITSASPAAACTAARKPAWRPGSPSSRETGSESSRLHPTAPASASRPASSAGASP